MNKNISRIRILKHIFFWTLYILISAAAKAINQDQLFSLPYILNYLANHFYYIFTDITATYLTVYYIFPKFLYRGKYLKFALSMFLSIIIFVHLYRSIVYFYVIPVHYPEAISQTTFFQFDYLQYFSYCYVVVGIMAFFKLVEKWIISQKESSQLRTENATSQLQLLRSQLSPHFLFNTLNNIDSLIYQNPEKASSSIIKLSEIMRYMLYDAKNDKVTLENEIINIENIVELQKIRMVNPNEISLTVKGNSNGHLIAPMMFVPFIENLFKHGICSPNSPSYIIAITIEDTWVHFHCSNHTKSENHPHSTNGIGLANVKKRLNLIYPENHSLEIINHENIFKVFLKLPLE